MIEIWLFGYLVGTVGGAALALLIVALASVTYLARTLGPPLRGAGREGVGRIASRSAALLTVALAIAGLRLGSPGSMGELLPTLAATLALAAAVGSSAGLACIGGARALHALGSASAGRTRRLEGTRAVEALRLDTDRRAYLEGADLQAEVVEADAAVLRLRKALDRLRLTRSELQGRLAALDQDAAAGDLGRELLGALDDVAAKLDLGAKILVAAQAAAFRIACSAPVKRLFRRRPGDVTKGLGGEGALEATSEVFRAFIADARVARESLSALESRRDTGDPGDPWAQATRDVEAVTGAYAAVASRLEVVRVRLTARAEMDAVTNAAGEVSDRVRASGLDAGELSDLVGDVSRAELAIAMATPGDVDTHTLAAALTRSTMAIDRSDEASIDDLLRAMRELA